MNLKTLHDIPELSGKKVFLRVDFNVPLDDDGNVLDAKRIKLAVPTIQYLLDKGVAQIIITSHLGRPKNNEPNLMTNKVAEKLGELIGQEVAKVDDWGENGLPDAKIVMLENIRFHKAEKSKDEAERDEFGKQLASLADIYVNEAFSNSHRAHASMTSVPKFIPGYAGLGLEQEVSKIAKAIESPEHPLVALVGGLKADKLKAVYNLMKIADKILIGGAISYNLLKIKGYNIGDSKADDEGMEEMSDIVKEISESPRIELPVDAVVADAFDENANFKEVPVDSIEDGWMALDIGSKTREKYIGLLKEAKTILWFGPVGVFEMEPTAGGTKTIGQAIADSDAFSIIGGGDSAGAVKKLGLADKMSLVSTGGGASLTMIEGKKLPALSILEK